MTHDDVGLWWPPMKPKWQQFLTSRWPTFLVVVLGLGLILYLIRSSVGMTLAARQPRLGSEARAFQTKFGTTGEKSDPFALSGVAVNVSWLPRPHLPNENTLEYMNRDFVIGVTFWRGGAAKIAVKRCDSVAWSSNDVRRILDEFGFQDANHLPRSDVWISSEGNKARWESFSVVKGPKTVETYRILVFESKEHERAVRDKAKADAALPGAFGWGCYS